jgi:hypothetical protein
MGDQPVARPLPTHITKQTQNKRTQISMPLVELEHMIPVFERADISCLIPRGHCGRLFFSLSRQMLRCYLKLCGYSGGDYEQCSLMG